MRAVNTVYAVVANYPMDDVILASFELISDAQVAAEWASDHANAAEVREKAEGVCGRDIGTDLVLVSVVRVWPSVEVIETYDPVGPTGPSTPAV